MISIAIFLGVALLVSLVMNALLLRETSTSNLNNLRLLRERDRLQRANLLAENALLVARMVDHEDDCLAAINLMAACSCGTDDYNDVLDTAINLLQTSNKETRPNGQLKQ